jgi:hypothetical protein
MVEYVEFEFLLDDSQCRRHKAKPFKLPQMAPLPTERANQVALFAHSGVDYFGPYIIKDNSEDIKIWVAYL